MDYTSEINTINNDKESWMAEDVDIVFVHGMVFYFRPCRYEQYDLK